MGKYDDIEAREIKRDGLVAVRNSGRSSTTNQKGDAIMDGWLVDFKYTEKSFTLSRNVWAKVSTDAQKNGHHQPALKVIMEGDDHSTLRLWVIDDDDMRELRKERRLSDRLYERYPHIYEELENE